MKRYSKYCNEKRTFKVVYVILHNQTVELVPNDTFSLKLSTMRSKVAFHINSLLKLKSQHASDLCQKSTLVRD